MSEPRGGVYIGLGANLGDPATQIRRALQRLRHDGAIGVLRVSSLYRTAPWGRVDQPEFVNAVAELATTLEPDALVEVLLATERALGRVRESRRWGPRMIDLDLLLHREQVRAQPGCRVPHPHLTERAFALVPLAELAPDVHIPGHGTVAQELQRLGPGALATARRMPDGFGSGVAPPAPPGQ